MTDAWPTEAETLANLAVATFRLNGQLIEIAEGLARPVGLTAAWWQVLAAVRHEPLSVSDAARAMGLTRQSVQRIADLLVQRGLAEYRPNPRHARAKLLAPTDAATHAIAQLRDAHRAWAMRIGGRVGADDLAQALTTIERLSAALDAGEGPGSAPSTAA